MSASSLILNQPKRFRVGLVPLCALFFILSGIVDISLTPAGVANGYLAKVGSGTPSMEAVAHAAGEFRIAIANILWLKVVDHYHHQYMAQGGDWAKNKDVLPLLRIITALDPHFIQAYDVEMCILCETGQITKAKLHLAEGIRNNKESSLLVYDMAMIYAWYQKDYKSALPYAEKSLSLTNDPWEQHKYKLFCNTLREFSQKGGPKASTDLRVDTKSINDD